MFQWTCDFVLVQIFFQLVNVSQQGDFEHIRTSRQQSFDNSTKTTKSKILQQEVNTSNKNYPKFKILTQKDQRCYMLFESENS